MRVAVDIWCVNLAGAPSPSSTELMLLSPDERARHAHYLTAEPARVFATTRLALRQLTGRRLGCAPEAVRIAVDERGKPFLADSPRLAFNVSHCSTLALIAFCDVAAVGIDVETRAALTLDMPLSGTVCSPREAAWLEANPGVADVTITRLWTRKESVLKACGAGLRFVLSQLDLGSPQSSDGIVCAPELGRLAWKDLALPGVELGAVAVRSVEASEVDLTLRQHSSGH